MAPSQSRAWILSEKPTDLPVVEGANQTFKLETRELPTVQDDQVLLKTLYLSNDPAQRGWINKYIKPERLYTVPVKEGTPMHARGLCEVVESRSSKLPKGQIVTASAGWNEYAVMDAKAVNPVSELPGGLSITQYLGSLGTTGMTAYYGLVIVSEAKASDTVVVSGAAGATGSMVVQIAKNLVGCKKVIGIAGNAEKCKWVESLGADKCINYKDSDFQDHLVQNTDDCVDVYFDNIGGSTLDFILGRIARYGRVAACGAISAYNTSDPYGIKNWFEIISMRIQVRGFIVTDYINQGKAGDTIQIFKKAIEDGKLKVGDENEQVVDTKFEDIPKTWMHLFDGRNTGKLITKIV